MIHWLSANIGTIIVFTVLAVFVLLAVRKIISDKKKGKSTCGGNCGHCPMGGACHSGR